MDWVQKDGKHDHIVEELFEKSSSDASSESIDENFEAFFEEGDVPNEEVPNEERPLDDRMVKVFPNPKLHMSNTFFVFDREVHHYMMRVLQSGTSTTLDTLKTYDYKGMLDLKKWRGMKDELCVGHDEDRELCLYLKDAPTKRIPCVEDWETIVRVAHLVEGAQHQGFKKTLDLIKLKWCIDLRKHGIPTSYIKEYINACGCNNSNKASLLGSRCQNIDLNKEPPSVITLNKLDVEMYMKTIMIKHKTRLVMARSSQKYGASKSVVDYICHRGGAPRRKGGKKRRRTSKKCGCPFKV
ncbi:hypothetical protein L7F22_067709 [Adiantum nelumboides]|nr:hypothetical protein [Adiantum nelumboides]